MGAGGGALPAGSGGAGGGGAASAASSSLIVDTALNPLSVPALAQMLGWTEPATAAEALTLRIYLFLLETIRIEDKNDGELFVKRFLEGPQQIWDANQSRIFAIKDLWDVLNVPDDFLKFLKNIVGWTSELEHITDALDDATLRRLIRNAVALWKIRGTEDAMVSILTLLLGARIRSWNWFDFRWVSEETGFGHESDGFDPWNISIANDREMNVRIMDDGTINRQLVIDLANLFRPVGERVEITYLKLLDLFGVDGDDSQWSALAHTSGDTGADVLEVADGTAVIAALPSEAAVKEMWATPLGAQDLAAYQWSARLRGTPLGSFGLSFHRFDEDNMYVFLLDVGGTTFTFGTIAAGVLSAITTVPVPPGFLADELAYYMFRVSIVPDGVKSIIKCYVDGVKVIDTLDSTFSSGEVGVLRVFSAATVEVDEAELLGLPIESDFVDINS